MDNNTCGVRWYESKWDGWVGMEEQIIATDILSSVLVSEKKVAPLSSTTGGNSTSNPNAGTSTGSNDNNSEKPITAGDKAGAAILTVTFVTLWGGLMAWMVLGGPM
jgi:mannan endo-1,6-alpha-mannosidase